MATRTQNKNLQQPTGKVTAAQSEKAPSGALSFGQLMNPERKEGFIATVKKARKDRKKLSMETKKRTDAMLEAHAKNTPDRIKELKAIKEKQAQQQTQIRK